MSIAPPRSLVKDEALCNLCNLRNSSRSLFQIEELVTIEKSTLPRRDIYFEKSNTVAKTSLKTPNQESHMGKIHFKIL